jgi:hypothetical protein
LFIFLALPKKIGTIVSGAAGVEEAPFQGNLASLNRLRFDCAALSARIRECYNLSDFVLERSICHTIVPILFGKLVTAP